MGCLYCLVSGHGGTASVGGVDKMKLKIKCPICEQVYGREEWMVEEEKYPSLLGLAEWHVFYCEWCGAKLEVKLAKGVEKEVK